MNGDYIMKTFNLIMLVICSMSCGMNLMSSSWVWAGVTALGAAYWFVTLVKPEKKEVKKEFEVTMSDEAKEYFTNNNIKVVVNGKEVI